MVFALFGPIIILLVLLVSLMMTATAANREAKKRYQARQNQTEPHRVTFSREGLWEAGTFFALHADLIKLKSVKMTANPAVLHLKVFKTWQNTINGNSRRSGWTIHVPVPRGYEAEAEQLRQRYDIEVINPKKATYNPREPV